MTIELNASIVTPDLIGILAGFGKCCGPKGVGYAPNPNEIDTGTFCNRHIPGPCTDCGGRLC